MRIYLQLPTYLWYARSVYYNGRTSLSFPVEVAVNSGNRQEWWGFTSPPGSDDLDGGFLLWEHSDALEDEDDIVLFDGYDPQLGARAAP